MKYFDIVKPSLLRDELFTKTHFYSFLTSEDKDTDFLLVDSLNSLQKLKNKIVLFKPTTSSDLHKAITNKFVDIIVNPISTNLIFDEACANLLKEKNKPIIFNYNSYKNNSFRSIKQSQFIFKLLIKKQINFFFASFGEEESDVVDPIILIHFLKNLGLNEEFVKKQMKREEFEKTCLKKK